MKEYAFFTLLSLTAFAVGAASGASLNDPSIQLEAHFDQDNIEDVSGLVNLQSGHVSVAVARGTEGKMALGLGLHETSDIALGNFGRLSIKGMSTMDGMYQAVIDTELFNGQSSFNPLQVTLKQTKNGLQYSGATSLGYLSGTYESSTGAFVVSLDIDETITASATGAHQNNEIKFKGYKGSVNLGIVSAAFNMDDQMKILDYDVGGSLGLIYGTIHRNQQTKRNSYTTGLSLGMVNFEALIREDRTQTYSTQIDTGVMQFAYNADPTNDQYKWKGVVKMANMEVDYAYDILEGLTLMGKLQVGSSVVSVQRDSKGRFEVKVDRGRIIE